MEHFILKLLTKEAFCLVSYKPGIHVLLLVGQKEIEAGSL